MMRAILIGGGWLLLFILGGPSAWGREVRFITIDAAPWASVDGPGGRPQGVFPTVVAELERRTGHRVVSALQPFARIDRELEAGTQDCTIIVWNEERARIVRRGELVSYHSIGVVGARGVSLNTYDDLRRLKSISVLRGLSLEPRFDADGAMVKDMDTDYLTGLRKLARGHVQGVAGAVPTILFLARQNGLADAVGPVLPLGSMELVLQCGLNSPNLDVMEDFNAAIRAMRQDGTMERILREFSFS